MTMTKTDWTAEEVRAIGAWCQENSSGTYRNSAIAAHMLAHLANRIEADESAVPACCCCGEPSVSGVRHRSDGPCYLSDADGTPAQEQPGWKVPDGWRLVPIKATEKMRQEGAPHAGYEEEEAYSLDAVWAAMLAASPTLPKER